MKKILISILCAALIMPGRAFAAHSDEWIEGSIESAYTYNQHLNGSTIGVRVDNGVVNLTGVVDSEVQKDLAEQIAYSFDGVKSVNNQLDPSGLRGKPAPATVSSGSSAADTRTVGQRIDDATTNASVRLQLDANRSLHSSNIKSETRSGVVQLSGSVKTGVERDLAEQLAFNTEGVRGVDNKIVVTGTGGAPERAKGTLDSASEEISKGVSDTWITTKVRSNILITGNARGSSVDVHTNSGVVTLSGIARDQAQKEEIGSIAREVLGVKEVRNEIKTRYS